MSPIETPPTSDTLRATAPGRKAQDADAGCLGESLLLVVEGQQGFGSDFDGDMEEVHPADGNGESVFGAEFARGADGVAPVELRVRPVAEPDFLL